MNFDFKALYCSQTWLFITKALQCEILASRKIRATLCQTFPPRVSVIIWMAPNYMLCLQIIN